MDEYLAIIEGDAGGYSAYVPDLPGFYATGRTRAELDARIVSGIAFHIEGLREEGLPVPPPATIAARYAAARSAEG